MKTAKVPEFNISEYDSVFNRIKRLNEIGVELKINKLNWRNEFPKSLPVKVHIAHNRERLFLLYSVEGEVLRTVNNMDFQPVWQDSCVEFFMQREKDSIYRNFECNALGVLLAAKHESREKAENLSDDEMKSIIRVGSIEHRYEKNGEISNWLMYLEIPKKAMGFSDKETLSGQSIRANFYKCADKSAEPHYLSWSPINTPNPDFHVPQFFGSLELE